MKNNFKIDFFRYLFSAIFGLGLYFLFYLPLELLLTEFLFVTPKINPWINTGVLFFFLLVANLFDWKKIIRDGKKLVTLLILVIIAFSFYGFYHGTKLNREYLPKIYQVRPTWIIQGQLIKIKGVNFGPVFKKGIVKVNGINFLIKDWNENKITAEAPVPSKSGNFYIFIETKEGKKSNLLPTEIKDPDYLKKYLR